MKMVDKIRAVITPVIEAMGYELWGFELHQAGKKTLLRIYIDMPLVDGQKSVNVDDCSKVSRQIGALFDIEGPISGGYNLEVSSPGMNRPLFNLEQYRRYIGDTISIFLSQPENGKRKFTGKLEDVFDSKIKMLVGDNSYSFELANIDKANLNF